MTGRVVRAARIACIGSLGWGCGGAAPAVVREGFVTTADSVRVYYRVVGEGEETVVVPVATFFGDRLDALALGRRLVLYDPRGRGRSDAVDSSQVSLEHQMVDLDAVRAAVGAGQVALIGWSGLGMELFVYTLRHPDRVTRLVQLAPVPPRQRRYVDQMIADRMERVDSAALAAAEAQRARGDFVEDPAAECRASNRVTLPVSFADPATAAQVPDVCVYRNEWPANLGPYFRALLGSFGDYDWRSALPGVQVPRLVIHGAEDNIPLEGNQEWVMGQPNARLLVVPGAGHWPHFEQPEMVLSAIDTFLDGSWPTGSVPVN